MLNKILQSLCTKSKSKLNRDRFPKRTRNFSSLIILSQLNCICYYFVHLGLTDLGQSPFDDPNGANSNYIDAGGDTPNSASVPPTITLQDFELLKVIGRGSYAKVFLAEYRPRHLRHLPNNRQPPRLYAMKVIKKSIVNDDEDIDWIQCEKNVFEKATNHPFLVGLHSCFQTPSRLFFVIEFVTGGDLMYHMQRQRKLPESSARLV